MRSREAEPPGAAQDDRVCAQRTVSGQTSGREARAAPNDHNAGCERFL
jgi:hypothetical protein